MKSGDEIDAESAVSVASAGSTTPLASSAASAASVAPPHRRWLRLLGFVAVLTLAAALLVRFDIRHAVQVMVHWATQARRAHPVLVGLASLLIFVVWSTCFLPTTPVELALSYLFGFVYGYWLVYVGKLIASAIAFALGVTWLRSWAKRGFGRHWVMLALENEAASQPYQTAFLLRAVYMPMFIKNYGSALLALPPAPYFAALVVLELPDTYVTAALGSTAKDLASILQGGHADSESWRQFALTAVQVVLLVLLIGYVAMISKRALDARRHPEHPNSRYQLASQSALMPGKGSPTDCR